MKIDAKMVAVCVACLVAGWWMAGEAPSPPAEDRPVLRWIAKTAKTLLWLSLIAEQPPAEQPTYAHARVGADGQPVLDHARGW
jgi:hypothetical protein